MSLSRPSGQRKRCATIWIYPYSMPATGFLKRMGRRTNKEELMERIGKLQAGDPGYCHPDYPDFRAFRERPRATMRS